MLFSPKRSLWVNISFQGKIFQHVADQVSCNGTKLFHLRPKTQAVYSKSKPTIYAKADTVGIMYSGNVHTGELFSV